MLCFEWVFFYFQLVIKGGSIERASVISAIIIFVFYCLFGVPQQSWDTNETFLLLTPAENPGNTKVRRMLPRYPLPVL